MTLPDHTVLYEDTPEASNPGGGRQLVQNGLKAWILRGEPYINLGFSEYTVPQASRLAVSVLNAIAACGNEHLQVALEDIRDWAKEQNDRLPARPGQETPS